MKISIEGFNQEYALSFKKMIRDEKKEKDTIIKIDVVDLVILRWFVDFYPKMDKFVINGKEYAWLSYSKLVEDLPIIDISKRSFADRLKKMVDFEILDFQLCSDKGNLTVYGFGDRYEFLLKSGVENFSGVCSLNNKGYAVQTTDIDKTINDKTINDINNINNISNKKEIEKEKIEKIYNYYLDKAIHYEYAKTKKNDYNDIPEKQIKAIKKTLDNTDDIESIFQTIDRYFEVITNKNYFFDTFWNVEKFFGQGNAYNDFTDEGSKWVNYQIWKNKQSGNVINPYSSGDIPRETAYPDLKKNYL